MGLLKVSSAYPYMDLKRQLITVKNQTEEVRDFQRCLALYWYIRLVDQRYF